MRVRTGLGTDITDGDSVAVQRCLPDRDRRATATASPPTSWPRRCGARPSAPWPPGAPSTWSCRCARPTASAATSCRATSTAWASVVAVATRASRGGCGSSPRPTLLRYVVEKGSIAVDGVSLTVAEVADDALRRRAHPGDARAHDARRREPGRPRQHRGGRARQVRREAARRSTRMTTPQTRFATIEEAIEDIRAGKMVVVCDDAGPRERGRPDDGGAVRHAGRDQLHGQGRRAA